MMYNGISAKELAKSKPSLHEAQGKVSSTSFISSMCYLMLFFDKIRMLVILVSI